MVNPMEVTPEISEFEGVSFEMSSSLIPWDDSLFWSSFVESTSLQHTKQSHGMQEMSASQAGIASDRLGSTSASFTSLRTYIQH